MPNLPWYPIVTALQVGVDTSLANEVPPGYGNVYAPEHYIDGWLEVTQPSGMSASGVVYLKSKFTRRHFETP